LSIFKKKNEYDKKFKGSQLYAHITCALDTQNCKKVFKAVRDTCIEKAMTNVGGFV